VAWNVAVRREWDRGSWDGGGPVCPEYSDA